MKKIVPPSLDELNGSVPLLKVKLIDAGAEITALKTPHR